MLPECGDVSFLVAPNASEAASTLPPCSWKISAAQAPTLPKPCACNVAVSIITLNTGKMMMGPLLHEVMLTTTAVLWAFMCRQSHAAHLHSAKCIICTQEVAAQFLREGRRSVAAAATSAGEHNHSMVLPTRQGSGQMTCWLLPCHMLLHGMDWCM